MRTFIALLGSVMVLTTPLRGAAESSDLENMLRSRFGPEDAAGRATDIVVVDPKGRVIETWKGDLPFGATLPLETMLNYRPRRFYLPFDEPGNPYRADRQYIRRPPPPESTPPEAVRYVLFLVQPEILDRSPLLAGGWLPANPYGWFDYSAAWINRDGLVTSRRHVDCLNGFVVSDELSYKGLSEYLPEGTEAEFRKRIMACRQSSAPGLSLTGTPDSWSQPRAPQTSPTSGMGHWGK
jgi:hypothetical protein